MGRTALGTRWGSGGRWAGPARERSDTWTTETDPREGRYLRPLDDHEQRLDSISLDYLLREGPAARQVTDCPGSCPADRRRGAPEEGDKRGDGPCAGHSEPDGVPLEAEIPQGVSGLLLDPCVAVPGHLHHPLSCRRLCQALFPLGARGQKTEPPRCFPAAADVAEGGGPEEGGNDAFLLAERHSVPRSCSQQAQLGQG